jgi:hypothetical protein
MTRNCFQSIRSSHWADVINAEITFSAGQTLLRLRVRECWECLLGVRVAAKRVMISAECRTTVVEKLELELVSW